MKAIWEELQYMGPPCGANMYIIITFGNTKGCTTRHVPAHGYSHEMISGKPLPLSSQQ